MQKVLRIQNPKVEPNRMNTECFFAVNKINKYYYLWITLYFRKCQTPMQMDVGILNLKFEANQKKTERFRAVQSYTVLHKHFRTHPISYETPCIFENWLYLLNRSLCTVSYISFRLLFGVRNANFQKADAKKRRAKIYGTPCITQNP